MSLTEFKSFFPPQVINQLDTIKFCGSHGDPSMNPHLLEIMRYLNQENENLLIQVYTNGGARESQFWEELGQEFHKNKNPLSRIVFSIDGLEDTNHLYRRNVNWDKLMSNIKHFIIFGRGTWEFLVFKHNEHQVEQARKLAFSLGFNHFEVKRPYGFNYYNHHYGMPVFDVNGKFESFLYPSSLEKVEQTPISEYAINNVQSLYDKAIQSNKEMPELSPSKYETASVSKIHCLLKHEFEIYVDAHGNVHPCCIMAGAKEEYARNDYTQRQIIDLRNDCVKKKYNLNEKTLIELFSNSPYKNIEQSWTKPTAKEGKILFCEQMCGTQGSHTKVFKKD